MVQRAGKHIEKCEALCSVKNYPAGDLPGDARGLLTGLLGQTWDWQHLTGFKYFQEILPPGRARNRTDTDKGHSFTPHPHPPTLTPHPDPTCSPLLYPPPTPAWPSKISLAPEPTKNSLFPQPSQEPHTSLRHTSPSEYWVCSSADIHMHVHCELPLRCCLKPTLIRIGDSLVSDSQASPQPNLGSIATVQTQKTRLDAESFLRSEIL